MSYFNGGLHGWNDALGYHAPEPCTAVYCNDCAETAIPLPQEPKRPAEGWGRRHWDTGFKWTPFYGAPCHKCGRAC